MIQEIYDLRFTTSKTRRFNIQDSRFETQDSRFETQNSRFKIKV